MSTVLGSAAPIAFALKGHVPVPRLYKELAVMHRPLWDQIAFKAYAFIVSLYISIGYCGYAMFGSATQGNLVKNYSGGSVALLLRWLFGISNIGNYALTHHPLRLAAYSLLSRFRVPILAKKIDPMLNTADDTDIPEKSPSTQLVMIPSPHSEIMTVFFY